MLVAVTIWWLCRPRGPAPFRVRPRELLTPNETDFARRLTEAVEPTYRVMAQVSMGALIEPHVDPNDRRSTAGTYLSIRARFAQKVVDFVIVDERFAPVLLIELDDSTHDAERDAQRDAITCAAGYTTLRYESRAKPTVEQLRRDIGAAAAAPRRRRR